jgi:hypothetical protein
MVSRKDHALLLLFGSYKAKRVVTAVAMIVHIQVQWNGVCALIMSRSRPHHMLCNAGVAVPYPLWAVPRILSEKSSQTGVTICITLASFKWVGLASSNICV